MIKKISIFLLCLSIVSFVGCSSDENETPESTGINVTVYEVAKSSIASDVSYTGELESSQSVGLISKVSAKAMKVYVKEGDYVEAGDILATLDQTDIRLSYEQALAGYESALASYNQVVNSTSKQQTTQASNALLNAENAYNQALANYEREKSLYENGSQLKLSEQAYNDAKSNYDRVKQLFDMGGASKIELDGAYSTLLNAEENYKTVKVTSSASFDAAKIALSNAENALKSAKDNISLTQNSVSSSVSTAKAGVNSAKASLNIAQNALSNTTIISPISGYVGLCNIKENQMVSQGFEIFQVKNTHLIDATINVTESVIRNIEVGSKAIVNVQSADIMGIEGVCTVVNPIKNDMTGLYTVKVSIDNTDEKINVGMIADITLVTSSKDDIIKVPTNSLINKSGKYYLYIANGNKAEKREVKIGINDEEYTEILSGLKMGDKVIVDGKDYITDTNNEINIIK